MPQTTQSTTRAPRQRLADKPSVTAAEALYIQLETQAASAPAPDDDVERLLDALDHFITAHRQ